MRRTITALLGAAALAAAAAAPATAATSRPAVALTGGYKLCLLSDHSKCIKSNGVGNTATIVSSNWSTWSPSQVVNSSTDIWYNQSGNCLRARTSGYVEVSSSCSGDTQSYWTEHTSPNVLSNYGLGGDMTTHSDTNGAQVDLGDSWRMTWLAA